MNKSFGLQELIVPLRVCSCNADSTPCECNELSDSIVIYRLEQK